MRKYPREAFETFFYYKPRLIFHTMTKLELVVVGAAPTEIIWLALLQGALLAGFVVVQPPRVPIGDAMNRAGMLLLFVIPGLLPPLVVWEEQVRYGLDSIYDVRVRHCPMGGRFRGISCVKERQIDPEAENDPNVAPGSPAPVAPSALLSSSPAACRSWLV